MVKKMNEKWKRYGKLFWSVFYISACTFGGGYVIVPLMRKRFVEELHWLKEEEILDLIAIAQSSPGAIAVNGALMIGYRVCGLPGAAIAVLGTVLPPLLILSVISVFYNLFITNPIVAAVLKGMQAGIGAVIVDVVWTMGAEVAAQKDIFSLVLMAVAFAAACFGNINVIYIILIAAILGIARLFLRSITKRKKGDKK